MPIVYHTSLLSNTMVASPTSPTDYEVFTVNIAIRVRDFLIVKCTNSGVTRGKETIYTNGTKRLLHVRVSKEKERMHINAGILVSV